jgi:hypothetical protein
MIERPEGLIRYAGLSKSNLRDGISGGRIINGSPEGGDFTKRIPRERGQVRKNLQEEKKIAMTYHRTYVLVCQGREGKITKYQVNENDICYLILETEFYIIITK